MRQWDGLDFVVFGVALLVLFIVGAWCAWQVTGL